MPEVLTLIDLSAVYPTNGTTLTRNANQVNVIEQKFSFCKLTGTVTERNPDGTIKTVAWVVGAP